MRTRQCRLVLWGERVWRSLIEDYGVHQQEKIRRKLICLFWFPLYRWKHNQGPWTFITHITFRRCRVRFCWTTFVETAVNSVIMSSSRALRCLPSMKKQTNNNYYYTLSALSLFWLAESVLWIFEISACDVITADYTIILTRFFKVTGNHVMYDRGAWFLRVVKFAFFVLLSVSEEAKKWL